MPKFKYVASDAQGKEKNGVIEAVNRVAALVKIKGMGLFPSNVAEVSGKASKHHVSVKPSQKTGLNKQITLPSFLRPRVKKKQLMAFTRQLSTLIDAAVPLLRALQTLQKQEKNPTLKNIINEMCETVESGGTFAEALNHYPKVFDKLFVNMIKAGEIGGVLEVTLNRLAEFIEKAEKIKTKVKGAMVYPVVVMVMALGITSFLMVYIIPKFSSIFEDLLGGASLPMLTQLVMRVSDVMIHRSPVIVGVIVLIVILFRFLGRTRIGRYQIDALKLKMPIFGTLIVKVSISRFARTLGTLLTSGVQILQALTIVRETSGNAVVSRAIQSVHDSVKEGETVAAPLEVSGVFPTIVVSMITVGEETGKLPDMLVKIADTYDTDVDAAVDAMTSIIEPVLIVFLAVVVGTIVVAMFMPLMTLISNIR